MSCGKPLRTEYPGVLYHVTSCGNARNKIFSDDQDREVFLSILGSIVTRYRWLCHAYCLTHNHYHLMIETPDGNLSIGMRQMNGIYTKKYNRRYNRPGHIFQGRFKAILVQKESYLSDLCRYVVLNPVRAKLVKEPGAWKWSSYQATAGLLKKPDYLTTGWVLGLFHSKRIVAQEQYRMFVGEGIGKGSPWDDLQGQVLLGEEGFVDKLKDLLDGKKEVKEIPRLQRYVDRLSLDRILFGQKGKAERDIRINAAHIRHGYTLKEIADYL